MARVAAVIGASRDRRKFGNKAVRAFRRQGFEVVPVNPRGGEIEGLPVFASVLDVSGAIDVATVYLQPDVGVEVLEQMAVKGIPEVWLNPGADAPAVVARARELGLNPIVACSIVGIGDSPACYPDA